MSTTTEIGTLVIGAGVIGVILWKLGLFDKAGSSTPDNFVGVTTPLGRFGVVGPQNTGIGTTSNTPFPDVTSLSNAGLLSAFGTLGQYLGNLVSGSSSSQQTTGKQNLVAFTDNTGKVIIQPSSSVVGGVSVKQLQTNTGFSSNVLLNSTSSTPSTKQVSTSTSSSSTITKSSSYTPNVLTTKGGTSFYGYKSPAK